MFDVAVNASETDDWGDVANVVCCRLPLSMMMSPPEEQPEREPSEEIDPIWTSSRTARQIYALGEVERVCCSLQSC